MNDQTQATSEPADEVSVDQVTAPDPQETEEVKLVSGEVAVPVAAAADPSAPVKSDMHCRLLVSDGGGDRRTVVEQHVDAQGEPAGKTVHRYPEQVVVRPVECPTCGKIVERQMLVAVPGAGEADCAIAINMRARGEDPKAKLEAAG